MRQVMVSGLLLALVAMPGLAGAKLGAGAQKRDPATYRLPLRRIQQELLRHGIWVEGPRSGAWTAVRRGDGYDVKLKKPVVPGLNAEVWGETEKVQNIRITRHKGKLLASPADLRIDKKTIQRAERKVRKLLVKNPKKLRSFALNDEMYMEDYSLVTNALAEMTPKQRRSALRGLKIDRTIIPDWGEHGDCMTAALNCAMHPVVFRVQLPNLKGYDSRYGEMVGVALHYGGRKGKGRKMSVRWESDPMMIMDGIQTVRYGNLETEHAPNLLAPGKSVRFEKYFTPAQLEAE